MEGKAPRRNAVGYSQRNEDDEDEKMREVGIETKTPVVCAGEREEEMGGQAGSGSPRWAQSCSHAAGWRALGLFLGVMLLGAGGGR